MKVSRAKFFRGAWKPAVGVLALGTLLVGCGDKESDPDALSVDELKGPGALSILDQGNGKVRLTWSGSNNEDDFDGYNVYGMKDSGGNLTANEGKSVELLDDAGEPVQTARDYLALYNFDPADGKKLEAKGDATNEDGEVDFSALPIHSGAADARLLPTCKNDDGACVNTTEANKEQAVSDNSALAVNGNITYDVSQAGTLKVGSTYCFVILSSTNGGENVSATSSNVACVEPKYAATFDLTLPTAGTGNQQFDLRSYLTSCDTAGTCAAPTAAQLTTAAGAHYGEDDGPIYIEANTGTGIAEFVAGENSAVIDLGEYKDGLADASLPNVAPTLVIDSDVYDAGGNANRTTPVYNGGGYSLPGQSLPILPNHVYILAVGALGTVPTQFNYHWLHVKGETDGQAKVSVEMRLSKNKQ